MRVILARPEELSGFSEIYYRFYDELRMCQGFHPPQPEVCKKEAFSILKSKNSLVFLATDSRRAVGFMRVSLWEGAWFAREIYVLPECRRKGIGRALVVETESEIVKRGETSLYALHVLPQDDNAIAFWKSLGYDVLNSIELVKDIKPTARRKGGTISLGSHEFYLW